ncbi:heterokaryon incompatibility (HET) domain protein [Fusarium sp. NRRL 52700]|nr:heterokaryon incompatibility (HET) domain protein [Fusarium sp. NRRL 52700]
MADYLNEACAMLDQYTVSNLRRNFIEKASESIRSGSGSSPAQLSNFSITDELSNRANPADQYNEIVRGLQQIDRRFKGVWPDLCNKYYGRRGNVANKIPSLPNNSGDDEIPKFNGLRLDPIKINFEALKMWLDYCKCHHSEACQTLPGYPRQLSCLKVIDCQTGAIVKAPEACQFAALSYVWGQPQNNESTPTPRAGFLPANMPKTIFDAIQATIRLDLQYLWVDQYCINQQDKAELAKQVGIMDMVYNLATVTLIAACGKNANFGLPGVSSTSRQEQPVIDSDGQTYVTFDTQLEARIKRSPWWSRAWTYQEGIFSTRCLFFTETEVYFECNTSWTHESLPYDLYNFNDRGSCGIYCGAPNSQLAAGLDQHLVAISQRQLTYQSDALNTLGGVFRTFSYMSIPIRHFWGIPMEQNHNGSSYWAPSWDTSKQGQTNSGGSNYLDCCFADGLGWIPEITSNRREGFPSWSWSGWVGPLRSFKTWATPGTSDVRIWLQRANGTYSKISEAVINQIDATKGSDPVPYTQKLRIQSRTIALTFKYLPENDFKRPARLRKWTYTKPVYFVVTAKY